jgi:hypothetical protein
LQRFSITAAPAPPDGGDSSPVRSVPVRPKPTFRASDDGKVPRWERGGTPAALAGLLHDNNRHQEINGPRQSHVLAAIQAELPGLFTAEAQGEKAVFAQETNRADHSPRGGPLCCPSNRT